MTEQEQELNQIFDVDGNPLSEDAIAELTNGKGDDSDGKQQPSKLYSYQS